jgi:hypothetical protein
MGGSDAEFLGLCAALAFALLIALSGGAGAKVGDTCGGFVINPHFCGPHEFCQRAPGKCFIADLPGKCAYKPEICILHKGVLFIPECGCNGVTYSNDCERRKPASAWRTRASADFFHALKTSRPKGRAQRSPSQHRAVWREPSCAALPYRNTVSVGFNPLGAESAVSTVSKCTGSRASERKLPRNRPATNTAMIASIIVPVGGGWMQNPRSCRSKSS